MLHCARTQWFSASVCFALASAFRSNGILLGGFVVWGMLVQPFLDRKRVCPPYIHNTSVTLRLMLYIHL